MGGEFETLGITICAHRDNRHVESRVSVIESGEEGISV
jgi:hypothetical protein